MAIISMQQREIIYKTWKIKISFLNKNQALDDLNLAFKNSNDLKPTATFSYANITFIKNTLNSER